MARVACCAAALVLVGAFAAPAAPQNEPSLAVEALPLGLPDDVDDAATILAAEDRRSLDDALLRLTGSPRAEVRARAALALGRVGLPAAYPRLTPLLRDVDARVRALAAFALGLLEVDLEPATVAANRRRITESLLPLLRDPEAVVAAQSLWAVGALADSSAVPAVRAILADPTRPDAVVEAALDAWWRLPGATPEPAQEHLRSGSVAVRRAAATALRRFDDANALPALADALEDPDGVVRAAAIRGVRRAPPAVVRRHLLPLLRDDDWRVVAAALGWVTDLWRDDAEVDDEVFTAVLMASANRNRHLQRLAFTALAAAPGKFSVPEDRLVVALRSGDATTRMAAVDALGSNGATAEHGLDELLDVYGIDGPPRESSAAEIPRLLMQAPLEAAAVARALGAADQQVAGDWLRLLVAHGPIAARAEGLRQLRRVAPDEASALAASWLVQDDPVLRAVAAQVVQELAAAGTLARRGEEAPTWFDLLWTAQREVGEVAALEPRLVLLGGLQSIDSALLQLRVAALLPDPDRVVRLWALRNLGPPQRRSAELLADALAPLDTGRTAADYRRLAQAALALQQRPPHFAVETGRGTFVWELRADWAPLAAIDLLAAVQDGFYDGLVFHRVVPDFVIQAGDPSAVGMGGAPGSLRSEETPVAFSAGTVGLALAGRDTGGSQFFITDSAQPHLRGRYPVVGRVVDNARFVERIQPGDQLNLRLRQR